MSMRSVPLLPLRDIIVFPHMVVPLFVGREKSIAALEEGLHELVQTKDSEIAELKMRLARLERILVQTTAHKDASQ